MDICPLKTNAKRVESSGQSGMSIVTLILFIALVVLAVIAYPLLRKHPAEQESVSAVIQNTPAASKNELANIQKTANQLAIGDFASEEEIDINLNSVMDLDFMSKSEVYDLRTDAVYQYPELIEGDYIPSRTVFGQIEDGRPWWGTMGASYGRGNDSIEGPSMQSVSILNPYLLAVPDLIISWNMAVVPEEELGSDKFPVYCEPYDLRWYPALKKAEVHYSKECAQLSYKQKFSFLFYNARDFNLKYVYVSYDNSTNISKDIQPNAPVAIKHYIHRGGSCGYPGGCNNVSPSTPPTDDISITGWPAKAVVWFWKDKPASYNKTPDMEFIIYFE